MRTSVNQEDNVVYTGPELKFLCEPLLNRAFVTASREEQLDQLRAHFRGFARARLPRRLCFYLSNENIIYERPMSDNIRVLNIMSISMFPLPCRFPSGGHLL